MEPVRTCLVGADHQFAAVRAVSGDRVGQHLEGVSRVRHQVFDERLPRESVRLAGPILQRPVQVSQEEGVAEDEASTARARGRVPAEGQGAFLAGELTDGLGWLRWRCQVKETESKG